MSPEDKSIVIPTNHYVGFQSIKDELPLGFLTPDGTDSQALKRKATVDGWCKQSKIPSKSIENKPMSGFKFSRNVIRRYGWGSGSVSWRVEDPRGFQLEISSPNLTQIMACTTIENGEILEKCVWGRLKSENVLIPISSDVYKSAVLNTTRISKVVSIKDVELGDKIITHEDNEYTYMGYFNILNRPLYDYGDDLNRSPINTASSKRHVGAVFDENGDITRLAVVSAFKISEVNKDISFSYKESEQLINDRLNKTDLSGTDSYNACFTQKPVHVHNLTVTRRNLSLSKILNSKKLDDFGFKTSYLFTEVAGQRYVVSTGSFRNLGSRNTTTTSKDVVTAYKINHNEFDTNGKIVFFPARGNTGGYSYWHNRVTFEKIDLDIKTLKDDAFWVYDMSGTSTNGSTFKFTR